MEYDEGSRLSPTAVPTLPARYTQNGITVVPLTVHFRRKTTVEISSSEFRQAEAFASKTSQPSLALSAVYEHLLKSHDFIFSVHISSKMSGTVQSAQIAAETVNPDLIEVIDGRAVSLVTGLMVLEAAEAIRQGKSVDDVRESIRHVMDNFGLYWTLDTLEYLQKNGRIGRATAFIGGLLSIKPIMSIEEGEIAGVERVRGSNRVFPRILELMHSQIRPGSPIDVIVLHADDEPRGKRWLADVQSEFNRRRTWLTDCGPIVGTHAGLGTIAVAWVEPEDPTCE